MANPPVPDNFRFNIVAAGNPLLEQALALAFANHGTATHWKVEQVDPQKPRFILAWGQPSGSEWHLLPGPMSVTLVAPMVINWLNLQDYGPAPDLDGNVKHGFRVYNEQYGRIGDDDYAFVAIEPVWAEYHQ